MGAGDNIGLSTNDALGQLHSDLKSVLEEVSQLKNGWFNIKKSWIYDTLHHRSNYTTICWTSATLLVVSVCALAIVYIYGCCECYTTLLFDVLVIFLLILLNLSVVAWDNNLRHQEILTRAKQLLHNLEKSKSSVTWNSLNYPNLCTPTSPCITLQWTYRDGEVVNLPWALLVRGDVIIIRPGQTSPGLCIPLDVRSKIFLLRYTICLLLIIVFIIGLVAFRIKIVLYYMLMKYIVLQLHLMRCLAYQQPEHH